MAKAEQTNGTAKRTRPRRDVGLGCAIGALALVFVTGLAMLALLLPPFSLGDRLFGAPFVALNENAPLTVGNLSLSAGGTANADLRVQQVEAAQFLSFPGPDDPAMRAARGNLPPNAAMSSALYWIEQRGTTRGPITLSLVGTESERLDLYAYQEAARRWVFLPARPQTADGVMRLVAVVSALPDAVAAFRLARQTPVVSAVIEPGQALKPSIAEVANVIHPAGLRPIATGALEGALPAGVEFGRGYAVVPVIRSGLAEVGTVAALLTDENARAEHIGRLLSFAESKPYDGLAIDYRDLPSELRGPFSAFIAALAEELRAKQRLLTVVLPFPTAESMAADVLSETGSAYDFRALGRAADTIQLLLPVNPGTSAETIQVALRWVTGEVSRAKLQVALGTRPLREQDGAFRLISYLEALEPLGGLISRPDTVRAGQPLEINFKGFADGVTMADLVGSVPTITGSAGGTIWLPMPGTLRERLGFLLAENTAGALALDLAAPGASPETVGQTTAILAEYKLNPATWYVPAPAPLIVEWTVRTGEGVVSRSPGAAGIPFVYTPDGTYNSLEIQATLAEFNFVLGSVTIRIVRE